MRTLASGNPKRIVVVGAGFAGLSAAIRARELGAAVTVVESSTSTPSWSNSRLSGGRWHIAYLSPLEHPTKLAAAIRTATGGTARPDITESFTRSASRAFGWIKQHGARFVDLKGAQVMVPVRPNRIGDVWRGRAGDVVLRRLQHQLVAMGAEYLAGWRGVELSISKDGPASVVLESASGERRDLQAQAVVLADGGFQGRDEFLTRFAGISRPDLLVHRGAATGRGDGLRMALEAGGVLVNPEALYAHLLHRDATTNARLSPYPLLDKASQASILVRQNGRRFCDEYLGGVASANRVARLGDGSAVWLIFDRHVWWNDARLNQVVPPNPNLLIAGARIEREETIGQLASRIGVDGAAMEETMTAFNVAAAAGSLTSLTVPRTGNARPLRPPYYAVPVAVGLTYTLGGAAVDGHARVLDAADRPVRGLYAAGSAAGGLSGGPKPGYAGGISVAVGLGMLAAEHAVGLETNSD